MSHYEPRTIDGHVVWVDVGNQCTFGEHFRMCNQYESDEPRGVCRYRSPLNECTKEKST